MNKKKESWSDDTFPRLLRAAGYKVTEARLAVLEILAAIGKPLSVDEVKQYMQEHTFDQATVYRTLHALTTAGVVRKIDFQRDYALYELQSEKDHHHVVCLQCHRVEDVEECCTVDMDTMALKQSGFAEIKQHSLEFFGLCQSCKA